jgi:hypothetical protein
MYARSSKNCFRVSLLSSVLDHKQTSNHRQVYDGFCFGREDYSIESARQNVTTGCYVRSETCESDWPLHHLHMAHRFTSRRDTVEVPRTNVEVRYELPTAVQTTGHCALELT